jgi:glycosyltransferase involved in cell wall biosynthesis
VNILIVTPTLGDSRWLEETVASVAAQGASHVLAAPAVCVAALAARFPGVKVVAEPPGGGMYAAINAAVAAADGAWEAVGYLNDDDVLLAGFDRVARAVADAGTREFAAYGRVRLIDGAGRRLGAIPVSPAPALNRALYAERLEPVYQHGTLFTRVAWERLGGCDSNLRYCGDSDLLARACLAGIPFACVAGEVAAFRLRPGQLTKNRSAMLAERAEVDERLGLLRGVGEAERRKARRCFRRANFAVYAERVVRHGFISFDELLMRGGQS